MIKDFIFNQRVPLLNRAMDAYALRQQTAAKNIANADTPHYRPEKVKFEELFHNEEIVLRGSQSSSKHLQIGNYSPNPPTGEKELAAIPEAEVYFAGENHVNIDKEMSELAQNQIRFRLTSQMVRKYFSDLSSAISGQRQ